MKSISLDCVIGQQATSDTGTGTAVAGANSLTFLFPKATSGKLKGSTDGGSTFDDIEGTAFTGSGTNTPSITLLRCRFDHVRAVFAGSGACCVTIHDGVRVAPLEALDRDLNMTIADPILGTA